MAGITDTGTSATTQVDAIQTHYSKKFLEQQKKTFVLPEFGMKSPL